MSQEQASIKCRVCDRPTLHARKKCSHLIHALVSLFLCGLWIPVWLVADHLAAKSDWRCQTCGTSPVETGSSSESKMGCAVFIALILIAACIYALSKYGILPDDWK